MKGCQPQVTAAVDLCFLFANRGTGKTGGRRHACAGGKPSTKYALQHAFVAIGPCAPSGRREPWCSRHGADGEIQLGWPLSTKKGVRPPEAEPCRHSAYGHLPKRVRALCLRLRSRTAGRCASPPPGAPRRGSCCARRRPSRAARPSPRRARPRPCASPPGPPRQRGRAAPASS